MILTSRFARGLGRRRKNTLSYLHTADPAWVSFWDLRVNQSRRATVKMLHWEEITATIRASQAAPWWRICLPSRTRLHCEEITAPSGLPRQLCDKGSACQAGDTGSIPESGTCTGEGNGNPLQLFLPGKSHGQGSLAGCSCKRVRHTRVTKQQQLLPSERFKRLVLVFTKWSKQKIRWKIWGEIKGGNCKNKNFSKWITNYKEHS